MQIEKPQYPLVLIPYEYQLYQSGDPYPNSFTEKEPLRPKNEVHDEPALVGCFSIITGLAGFCVVIFIIALFAGEKISERDTVGITISIVCLIVGYFIYNSNEVSKTEVANRNKHRLENYHKERERYFDKRKKFDRLKRIQANEELDKEYRSNKLVEILSNSEEASIRYKGVKGKSEKEFLKTLRDVFGNRILSDVVIEIFASTKPYQPDVIFHHEELNAWVDIEIDEVYDMLEKKPIHYVDEYGISKDDTRNEYFLNKGWFIIRFSENQVITNPMGCCKFINEFLITHLGVEDYGSLKSVKWKRVSDLQSEFCWTCEEAIEVAKLNKRRLNT